MQLMSMPPAPSSWRFGVRFRLLSARSDRVMRLLRRSDRSPPPLPVAIGRTRAFFVFFTSVDRSARRRRQKAVHCQRLALLMSGASFARVYGFCTRDFRASYS